MTPGRPEVADVIAQAGATYQATHRVSSTQARILRDLPRCRTAALGGHTERCADCGHEVIAYNSCRNRHCPKCQARARAQWLADRAADLLPVPYFHVVFTIPAPLGPLALRHPRVLYGLLFRAAASTLCGIARDPQHLGADIGFLAVLHTWGQTLQHHPHLHCVVPGGGLALDGGRWVACRPHFFLPVRVLSRRFRTTFLRLLRAAFARGHLAPTPLTDWAGCLRELARVEWVVYAKPPFGGPRQVLKYLARYTHRVAIANQRLVAVTADHVDFRWTDYAHGHRHRTMRLEGVEFLRRFLLHALPRGFQRLRQYGLLANRRRAVTVARCRALLGTPLPAVEINPTASGGPDPPPATCPRCGSAQLVRLAVPAAGAVLHPHSPPSPWNTS